MIFYKKGFKYQLVDDYSITVAVCPEHSIDQDLISLASDGLLTIRKHYAWDGPSGPAIDTKNFMRASLVHDALYQLMRQGLISQECRKTIDQEMRRICIEDGMGFMRSWWTYTGVRWGATRVASTKSARTILSAP